MNLRSKLFGGHITRRCYVKGQRLISATIINNSVVETVDNSEGIIQAMRVSAARQSLQVWFTFF